MCCVCCFLHVACWTKQVHALNRRPCTGRNICPSSVGNHAQDCARNKRKRGFAIARHSTQAAQALSVMDGDLVDAIGAEPCMQAKRLYVFRMLNKFKTEWPVGPPHWWVRDR